MSEARPRILQLPVDAIALDPDQPRRHFPEDKLEMLAASFRASAVLQPVTVTRNTRTDIEAPYLLLFGARRFLAARRAGLAEVPAIVREGDLTPAARILLQLTENDQREDLTLLDRALAYARAAAASGLADIDFAAEAGISRSFLSRYLWLARCDGFVREALEADLVRHLETARQLSRLPASQQQRLLRAARRTGEPITLSKVQRAQAAAEAMLPPDAADLDLELTGDGGTGVSLYETATLSAAAPAEQADAASAASPPGGPGEVLDAAAASTMANPETAVLASLLPLVAGSHESGYEATVLVPLPLPALLLLLERLGLTPTPNPDEAVRSLLGALLVQTAS